MCSVLLLGLLISLCNAQLFSQPMRVNNFNVLGSVQQDSSDNAVGMTVRHLLGSARSIISNGNTQTKALPAYYIGVYSGSLVAPANLAIASVAGATHEITAAFQSLFIYYNNDAEPGFQYASQVAPLSRCVNLLPTQGDCVDSRDVIDLSTLTWATIKTTVGSCPNGQFSDLFSQCKVWTTILVGSLNGTTVIELTSTTASHPVRITTVTGENAYIKPGAQKIDVVIYYPWAQRKSTLANPQVGLAVWSAGLALQEPTIGPDSITYFNNQLVASFGWNQMSYLYNGPVKTSTQPSQVYHQNFTGMDVLLFRCNGVSWCTALQSRERTYAANGWRSNLIFFSWGNIANGDVIMWDPTVQTSVSFRIVSSFTTGVLLVVFFWLFQ